MPATERERTYTWSDPASTAGQHVSLSGLEFIRALAEGALDHSPSARTLGFRVVDAGHGTTTIRLVPAEYHYNAVGTVHGGILTAILDSAMGFAISTTLPEQTGYTTLDLNTQFLRPVSIRTGPIEAVGSVVHIGRATATARGEIRTSEGKLCATATTRCMLFRPDRSP
ncbi:PaaI family thioesterase [Hoyosella sp. G463]|uniref:PaaI family thioesterase n=1 Tax=Lolliginicoccus lacisalsi TaxID=2742202 RepID=A0A927JCT1_9ACTN|nr:PaaI family thioesterase [Lolliginicoccus lacisalsi]MBD8506948.1 PaaI family thioesterase [Lolliginicoccus lacisalsi]